MGLLDRPYGETHTLGVSRGPVAGFPFLASGPPSRMRRLVSNIFQITRLLTGVAVFLLPGLLATWLIFVAIFPDTLRRYEMSNLEMLIFAAGVFGLSYFAYRATSWKRVMGLVAPLYLYDDWLSTRGE